MALSHGKKNQIEGKIMPGKAVVVIEDLISTAQSALHAADALIEEEMEVNSILAIFDYQLEASATALQEHHVDLKSLCQFETLLDVAKEQNLLSKEDALICETWQQDPQAWSKQRSPREKKD